MIDVDEIWSIGPFSELSLELRLSIFEPTWFILFGMLMRNLCKSSYLHQSTSFSLSLSLFCTHKSTCNTICITCTHFITCNTCSRLILHCSILVLGTVLRRFLCSYFNHFCHIFLENESVRFLSHNEFASMLNLSIWFSLVPASFSIWLLFGHF